MHTTNTNKNDSTANNAKTSAGNFPNKSGTARSTPDGVNPQVEDKAKARSQPGGYQSSPEASKEHRGSPDYAVMPKGEKGMQAPPNNPTEKNATYQVQADSNKASRVTPDMGKKAEPETAKSGIRK